MGRKVKEVSLGVTAANTCTSNKQTRAKRTSTIDVKQDELNVNKATIVSGAPIEENCTTETLLKDEDLEFNVKRPAIVKTYKSKVKKQDLNIIGNDNRSSTLSAATELHSPAAMSNINQRPRRQIKHKYIKARRNISQSEPIPSLSPLLATDTTTTKSTSPDTVNEISDKSEKSSETLADDKDKSLLYSNYKLARVLISDSLNLNYQKKTKTKIKTAKNNRRSGRQNTRSTGDDTTDEDLSTAPASNCHSFQSNIDDSINSNDTNEHHHLVELIDADDTHDIVEEIVQTTIPIQTSATDNIYDDTTEPYEFYQVIDNDNELCNDTPAETDNKQSYLVTVEESNSNSQFSQNSTESAQKIYVEISENDENQQTVDVITPFDSSDSQTSAIANTDTVVKQHKRNSFSGAFKSVNKRTSNRLSKNDNNLMSTINKQQISLNDNETSTSNSSNDIDLSNPSKIAMLQLKRLGVSIKRVNTNQNYTIIDSSDSDKSNKESTITKPSVKSSSKTSEILKIENVPKPAVIGTKRRSTRLQSIIAPTKQLIENSIENNSNINFSTELTFECANDVATKNHTILQSSPKLKNDKMLKDKLESPINIEVGSNSVKKINPLEFGVDLNNETVEPFINDKLCDNNKISNDNNSKNEISCIIDNSSTMFIKNKNLKTYSKRKEKLNTNSISTEKLTDLVTEELTESIAAPTQEHTKHTEKSTTTINENETQLKNHMENIDSVDTEKLSFEIIVEKSNSIDETETEQIHQLVPDDKTQSMSLEASIDEEPNELSLVENYLNSTDLADDNETSHISTEHSPSRNHVIQTKTFYNDDFVSNSNELQKESDNNLKISNKSIHDHDTSKNGGEKVKSNKSTKHRDNDSKKHDRRSKNHTKSSREPTESDRIVSVPKKKISSESRASIESTTSHEKPSTSKKSTEFARDKHTSSTVINDGKIIREKHSKKNRLTKESLTNDNKNQSVHQQAKPKDAYSILSECYLPKMVKHDESLYSIEAFKAAQAQAIADAKIQAEASAKARAEAAAKAAAAAMKAREEAINRQREEAAAKAREEAAAIKAREDEEKAKALAAANKARERSAAKQRAAEAVKARELAAAAAAKLLEEENKKLIEETKRNLFADEPTIRTEKFECINVTTLLSENPSNHIIKTETYIPNTISDTDNFVSEYTTIENLENNSISPSEDIKIEQLTEEETTIRRSGRLRTKTETNKREHGYGLVRDRERYLPYTMASSSADHGYGSLLSESSSYSGSLSDLNDSNLPDIKEEPSIAYQIPIKSDAEKEEESKNIAEGLALFEQINDNEYKCERIISKESKKMQCDCFLTKSEIERGELGCGEDCLNRLLMIECGSRCVVGDRCTNKRFQKIMNADCTIFKTDKKGFGMKAVAVIPEGEFIMEYVGEVLNSKQFEQRVEDYSHDNNIHHYFMALRNDCIIDATSRGNISRFINHSCDPNAETQKWTVNGELRVGFFSRRTIYPDQEITFDYKFRRYGKEAQKCYCNAENCRGWIGEQPDSDDEFEDGEEEEEEEEEEDEEKQEEPTDIEDKVENSKDDLVSDALNLETSDEPKLDTNLELNEKDTFALSDSTSTKSSIEIPKKIRKPKIKREKSKQRHKHTDISEDQDLDMEISILTKSNLKNQSHTLRFSRLMVRAKQQRAKSQLLYILRCGELACRRLFLDYHGLKLLYAWMCDRISKDMKIEWAFRLEILETLEVLPIPNKTMLKESKVLATIEKWSQIIDLKDCQIEYKSPDESPIDNVSENIGNSPTTNEQNNEQLISQIRYIASKLLSSWETLTEVFKIPKKLRIEQMKEHEREADLSYQALGLQTDVIAADEEEQRRKRFRRDTAVATTIGRDAWDKDKYHWDKDRGSSRYKDTKESSTEWNAWKIQRRQLFEAQVGVQDSVAAGQKRFEDDSVHAAKCSFFRIDPRLTSRRSIPFCVNPITGQWYTEDKRPIAAPPSHSHIKPPPQQKSKNPNDYNLPAMDLPEHWKYAIDDHGQIYYYHAKIRIPQWEPPIKLLPLFAENKNSDDTNKTKSPASDNPNQYKEIRNSEIGAIGDDCDVDSSDSDDSSSSVEELSDVLNNLTKSLNERQLRVDEMLGNPMQSLSDEISALATDQIISPTPTTSSTAALTFSPVPAQSITNKAEFDARFECLIVANRKKKQRAGLVSERIISPRTDEERIELKLEMRRYRENKEKLRRRKEEAKRRRQIEVSATVEPAKKYSKLVDGLPQLVYDDNDDDDDTTDDDEPTNSVESKLDNRTAEIQDEPLIPICIDELEALKKSVDTTIATNKSSHKSDHKNTNHKHKKTSSKSSSVLNSSNSGSNSSSSNNSGNHINSEDAKRIKDKFRAEIAGVIVQHLSPYRKENCQIGRITNNEDFKHLAKKLTHFVMLKELKHCDNTINVLVVTDSVKQKSKEFIRKYMGKFGKVYTKPQNEPEYKDFNNSQ